MIKEEAVVLDKEEIIEREIHGWLRHMKRNVIINAINSYLPWSSFDYFK
jgi:hypothetical protein